MSLTGRDLRAVTVVRNNNGRWSLHGFYDDGGSMSPGQNSLTPEQLIEYFSDLIRKEAPESLKVFGDE